MHQVLRLREEVPHGSQVGAKYFDHEGYLYHQHELEDQYAGRRAPSEIFV